MRRVSDTNDVEESGEVSGRTEVRTCGFQTDGVKGHDEVTGKGYGQDDRETCWEIYSVGHITGGCRDKDMKSLYIHKHNSALRTIQRYVRKGELGGNYTILDAGKLGLDNEGVHTDRLPEWLLPKLTTKDRKRYRPDLLIVRNMPSHNFGLHLADMERLKLNAEIYVMEVGYTRDNNYEEKYLLKHEQHERLIELLKAEGWKVKKFNVVPLGIGGTIYKTTAQGLRDFGVTHGRLDKLMQKLKAHSLGMLRVIVRQRRILEREHRDTG